MFFVPTHAGFGLSNEAAGDGELSRKGVRGSQLLLVTDGVDSVPNWDSIYASAEAPFVRVNGGNDIQIYLTAAQAVTLADALANEALKHGSVLPR